MKKHIFKRKISRIYETQSLVGGFTLIELLLSIALLTLVVGISSDTIITLVRINTKAQGANEVESVANFLSLKLQNDIKNSLDATVTNENRTLTLTKRDGSTVVYRAVPYSSGDSPPYLTWLIPELIPDEISEEVPLTNDSSSGKIGVECDGKCFVKTGGGTHPVSTTISLRIFQFNSPGTIFSSEVNFNDTFTVRGSY